MVSAAAGANFTPTQIISHRLTRMNRTAPAIRAELSRAAPADSSTILGTQTSSIRITQNTAMIISWNSPPPKRGMALRP